MHTIPGEAPMKQREKVEAACAYIDERPEERVSLKELAEHVSLSPWYLQRLFKKFTGLTPRDYVDARRAERFRDELRRGESVAAATYGAGYGSSSRVYEDARSHLGMTPASYARGGKGATIAFATARSPLGVVLVAATARGICFVCLGESESELVASLEREFPAAAAIRRESAAIAPALESVLAYLEGTLPDPGLPLDVRATAFQRRVWQELIAIPRGETRTYAEIARAMGSPGAQRAVGRACASNPVSLVIPCHRAIRSDGGLGGYRWGVKRKRALLEREAGAGPDRRQ